MHIATIIPIARGIPFDTLTYYAPEALAPGTLVTIPLGRQRIHGIVIESEPLKDAKTFVKRAAFSLKKISSVLAPIPYFEAVTGALKDAGVAAIAPVGAVAASVIPSVMFEYLSGEKLPALLSHPITEISTYEEKSVVGTRAEREGEYKRIIRSAFASKESVLFVAPTIRSLEWWKARLEKGIARNTMIFHSKVTKKIFRSQFAALKAEDIPRIYFTTPGFSVVPTSSIGTIVVEDESSNLYRSNDRYEIDARVFLGSLARRIGAKMWWGDTLPRFETLERTRNTHLPRTYQPQKLHVVPLEQYRTILPSEVIELIRHGQKKKRRLFLYTNRKGVAPLSRCGDCGAIVECPECSLPMALRNRTIQGKAERFFTCLHCGAGLLSDHTCIRCNSWNIVPVSIGTESIRDAVAQIVGAESVAIIDDDHTPDSKDIDQLLQTMEKQKFIVIIGTQKALPYLKRISYAIIPFFDRLLSTPSLYTTESILRLIMECDETTEDGVLICTKTPEFPFIKQLEMQKINAIIHDELQLRQQLGYPPFGMLLKVSFTVPEGYRQEVAGAVEEYVHELDHTALPARRISPGSMKILLSWLIKVPSDYVEEEGQALAQFLTSLRFPYKIEQNPERL